MAESRVMEGTRLFLRPNYRAMFGGHGDIRLSPRVSMGKSPGEVLDFTLLEAAAGTRSVDEGCGGGGGVREVKVP